VILTMLHVQPSQSGSLNARFSGSILRPLRILMAGGMPYETPSATTEAAIIALNALDDPRNMQPKMITKPVVRARELTGVSSLGCTLAQTFENGSPPSLANAYVIRLLVDMMPIVAKHRQPRGNISKHVAPARLPVA